MTVEQIKLKIDYYREKLYQAKCEEHRKINAIPWGAGFNKRGRTSLTISTTKSDYYKEMLGKWEEKLKVAQKEN